MDIKKLQRDDNGRMRVWCPEAKKYKWMFPVDVREAEQAGLELSAGPDAPVVDEESDNELEDRVAKANAKQLEAIVKELDLKVNLKIHEKLDDKRKAVLDAAKPKE